MKILIVHYRYFISGGPERYLFNLKDALEIRGHTVIPFSIRNRQNIESCYSDFFVDNIGKSDEVYVDKYPKNITSYMDLVSREFYSVKVKKALIKLIRETKPDICYLLVYKRALSPSVIDACKELDVPIVNRISDYNLVCGAASLYRNGLFCNDCFYNNDRGCYENSCIKGNRLFSIMRYLSIKFTNLKCFNDKIDAFVLTNGFMKEMIAKRSLIDNSKLNVISTFFREVDNYKKIDKSNCIGKKVEMLFIGNIDESKGIYDLLEALNLLKLRVSNFHLTIVGGLHVKENKRMINVIDEYGLYDYITFQPFLKNGDVFKYYLDTNITIIPARWAENLPNTLIESLYFHRPVVVPNWGSFKFTTDECISYRYDALSYKSLADVLYEICNNRQTILHKTNECESYFESKYAEKKHLESLLSLFYKVIESKTMA